MYKFKIYDYFKLFLKSLDRGGDDVRAPVPNSPIWIRHWVNRTREFRRFHRPMESIGNPRKTRLTICAIYTYAYCPYCGRLIALRGDCPILRVVLVYIPRRTIVVAV